MRVGFSGLTHLGQTLREATKIRGFDTEVDDLSKCDLILVTQDVEDHTKLQEVETRMKYVFHCPVHIPIVIVSQVPPGFTRRYAFNRPNGLFYQVDTIIMNCALVRATMPERFVVGCHNPNNELPPAYLQYLSAFGCPVFKMSYESAELVKLAINYYLAKQVETTAALYQASKLVGADWQEMLPGISSDARMGAYLKPGSVGGHLPRDVRTIEGILNA